MKKLLPALFLSLILLPFMAKGVSARIVELEKKQAAVEASNETLQPNLEAMTTNMFENWEGDTIWAAIGGRPRKGANGQTTYSTGIVGGATQAIAWMFNSPAASTERYVADVLDSAGIKIAQPAYAQGLGFASLDPILNTWKIFRNMAYLMFVVIFMVIGFLIMMRQKIGGQTVVTAQQAIPHIIVALLLVTFSYAIAGLVIDLMYLVMYLLLALFNKDQKTFLNKNFLSLGWLMISKGAGAAYEAVEEFSDAMTNNMSNLSKDVGKVLGSLTLATVVAIAIALKVVALFFELLKTYVSVILMIAFSPIILAMGAIPGKNTFKQWLTDLIGNLAAFPVVLLVLIVFDQLTNHISGTTLLNNVELEGGGFQPPYLFGGETGTAGIMPFIVGLGMLMIMPEIVKEAKKAMGAKEGVLGQLTRDMGKALEGGWKGGNLVPGWEATNTNKVPYIGPYLGSGESLAKTAGAGAGTVFGGIRGGVIGAGKGRRGAQKLNLSGKEKLGMIASEFYTGAKTSGSDYGAKTAKKLSHDKFMAKGQKNLESENE